MKRTLPIAALLLLSACEPRMVYVHDTLYVTPGYMMTAFYVIAALHVAVACGFVVVLWRGLMRRRSARSPE